MSITPANRARLALSSTTTLYAMGLAESPLSDYEVSADVFVASHVSDAIGPAGRIQSATVYYHARYNSNGGNWELYRFGPTTLLGSWPETIGAGQTRRATLRMVGENISLSVNGVTRISVTDEGGISLPGLPGIRGFTGGASDTTGLHLDNWLAESVEPEFNFAAVAKQLRDQDATMIDLRHNTAGQARMLGAFVNVADVTPATGLTIANTDIRILKPRASIEVAKNSGGALHLSGGRYIATFDATDTDTIGIGEISVQMTGTLPVRRPFRVLSQVRYDQKYGSAAYSTYAGGPVESVTNPVLVQASSVRAALGLTSANLTELLEAIPTTAPMTAEAVKAATLQAIEEFGPAKPGAEMGLLGTTIGMVADAVQVGFLDDEDGHAIVNTLVGAIGNQNIDELALVATIRAELERTTGPLGLLFDRLPEARAALIDKLNVAGTLAHTGNANLFQADTNGLLTLTAFNAALPANFSGLTIDPESGGIPASNLDTITIDASGIEINALTSDQAQMLVEIHSKTGMIGAGGFAEIVSPIGKSGNLSLHSGVDFVTGAAGPISLEVPGAVQDRAPAIDEAVYFQGRRWRDSDVTFEAAGKIVASTKNPGGKAVEIPIPRSILSDVRHFDDDWRYFVGHRSETLQDAFMGGPLTIYPGPIPPS